MKLLRYIILILLLWGVSSFSLVEFGETAGSYLSYLTYILLLLYYFLAKKRGFLFPMILLGLLYFIISGLGYVDDTKIFFNELIKYFILIICGTELARDTSKRELTYFLLFGALSILVHAIVYADDYGRYSGLYLNPNGAAFICLIGYCLTFDIREKAIKYGLIFVFTFAGALTFSRFFFLMWFLISLVSIINNKKNAQVLLVGFGSIILLLSVAAVLQVNTTRFSVIESLFNNNRVELSAITDDSRTEQWSKFYDAILKHPIFGNGYKTFSGATDQKQGVHNTYLMVIGEAGFIPFLIILGIYIYMLKQTFIKYKEEIYKFLLAFSLLAILTTMHNYFNNEVILFATIWLFAKIIKDNSQENEVA